jgi:hypothetical protein
VTWRKDLNVINRLCIIIVVVVVNLSVDFVLDDLVFVRLQNFVSYS